MTRVGVDCRPLIGNRTGIGRYTYEILRQFALQPDDGVVYYLYAPGEIEIPQECVWESRRFVLRITRFRPKIVWLHSILPLNLLRDRIHVFWGPNYAAPLLRFRRYHTVLTIHDATFLRFPETMQFITKIHNKWMLPWYVHLSDGIITDSKFSMQELQDGLLSQRKKISVVYLGATEFQKEKTGQDHGINRLLPRNRYILMVGTVEPRKNMESVVAAYSTLPQSFRNSVGLVIVGRIGWGGLNPLEWFEKYNVAESSRFFPDVDDFELGGLYAGADLFVFPSKYEGFGLPIIEAMKAGAPVACSNIPVFKEIAGDAAVYFNPAEISDMASVLRSLLENRDLRTEMQKRGYSCADRYTWRESAVATKHILLGVAHH